MKLKNIITDNDHSNKSNKYITAQEFNKLTSEKVTSRLAEAYLSSKNDIVNFVKRTGFDDEVKNLNKKVTSNKTKHVLAENEFKNLQTLN